MIKVTNLSFAYGGKPVFDGVSFLVGTNQKVGLVGPNGAGKSTLFQLITGSEQTEAGSIEVEGMPILVPQEIKRDPTLDFSRTVRNYIDPAQAFADYELKRIMEGLELEDVELSKPPATLSGGQKTKLAIARALLLEPDILLLDEPTNFLDTAGKKWVMDFLSRYPKTVVIVSHDLRLLDRAIDKVLAINPQTHKVEEYTGNYSDYKKQKKQRDELLKRQIVNEQKHIEKMKESLKKMTRLTSKKGVRQRTQLKKRITKLEQSLPELPKEIRLIRFALPEPAHVGELPVMVRSLSKSYGEKHVLSDVTFSMQRGERLALLGPNGAGKSTLIKCLLGIISPDSGEVVCDDRLQVGYYSQEFETFDFNLTLMETFEHKTHLGESRTRAILGKFMFAGPKGNQRVATLSGGEKTRLSIALLLANNYNFLVLDEPTTYLDVLSQRVILNALLDYQGAMLVVSHTPEFISELKPSRALILPQNKLKFWEPELVDLVNDI